MAIAFVDLHRSFLPIQEEILQALKRVWQSQQFILGSEVTQFEQALCHFLQADSVVGVASGTDALILLWKALGLSAEEEILTTPYSFFSSASSLLWIGSFPEFVDIHPQTYLMDKEAFLQKVQRLKPTKDGWRNPKTGRKIRGVLLVHLFGNPAEAEFYQQFCVEREWILVEDCAQALGAYRMEKPVGSFGIASTFSFYPTKNLAACGDAGAIASFSPSISHTLSFLRNHGQKEKYLHQWLGINSRMDELQAAILNVRWKYLTRWNEERRTIAKWYHEFTKDLVEEQILLLPSILPGSVPIYHQYVVRFPRHKREEVKHKLQEKGIYSGVYYPRPIHLQPPFRMLGFRDEDYPVAEQVARDSLALPIYPGLRREEVEQICSALRSILQGGIAI